MIRGLFTSATSMTARRTEQEIVTNNLANMNTAGYKRDRIAFHNVLDASNMVNDDQNFQGIEYIETDYSAGQFKQTDNTLDFALEGEGFFVVQNGNEQFYTRNGNFMLGNDGELLSSNGFRVMGADGPIVLRENDFVVNKDGTFLSENTIVGKLLVVAFDEPRNLDKAGYNLFSKPAALPEPQIVDTAIKQGALEESNVNPLEEMVNLIMISRDYNENQKSIQTQDSTLQKAVNDLGRI
ncbi:MAG: flagellar basal-body rod protein FlgF [Deferribacteres bacterium]|nr:flagellar basal-body rod protein FlgF [candidate division KSB1 bacterium]MCB9501956.1 flagellar basal-body rod protein FlgF [Deferribacteres bacterium]